jgi:hypothetical protein
MRFIAGILTAYARAENLPLASQLYWKAGIGVL